MKPLLSLILFVTAFEAQAITDKAAIFYICPAKAANCQNVVLVDEGGNDSLVPFKCGTKVKSVCESLNKMIRDYSSMDVPASAPVAVTGRMEKIGTKSVFSISRLGKIDIPSNVLFQTGCLIGRSGHHIEELVDYGHYKVVRSFGEAEQDELNPVEKKMISFTINKESSLESPIPYSQAAKMFFGDENYGSLTQYRHISLGSTETVYRALYHPGENPYGFFFRQGVVGEKTNTHMVAEINDGSFLDTCTYTYSKDQ